MSFLLLWMQKFPFFFFLLFCFSLVSLSSRLTHSPIWKCMINSLGPGCSSRDRAYILHERVMPCTRFLGLCNPGAPQGMVPTAKEHLEQ